MIRSTLLLLWTLAFVSTWAAGPWGDLYLRLAKQEQGVGESSGRYLQWVDQVASTCGKPQVGALPEKLQCLRKLVYTGIPLTFDSTAIVDTRYLLPDHLLDAHQGSCLPTAFLVLMVSERMGITAQPVSLPGHVYVKFPQGINWEPNRAGWNYTDQEYRTKYNLDASHGRLAKILSPTEFEGMFQFERGNIYRLRNMGLQALAAYDVAEPLWQDARIAGNRALVLDQQGKHGEALHIVDSLWDWGARDEELVWNRSVLMLRAGRSAQEVAKVLVDAQNRWVDSPRIRELLQRLQAAGR